MYKIYDYTNSEVIEEEFDNQENAELAIFELCEAKELDYNKYRENVYISLAPTTHYL